MNRIEITTLINGTIIYKHRDNHTGDFLIHRIDGPAMISSTGEYFYLYGNHYIFDDWIKKTPADKETKFELIMNYGGNNVKRQ